jgi:hypothetical protein
MPLTCPSCGRQDEQLPDWAGARGVLRQQGPALVPADPDDPGIAVAPARAVAIRQALVGRGALQPGAAIGPALAISGAGLPDDLQRLALVAADARRALVAEAAVLAVEIVLADRLAGQTLELVIVGLPVLGHVGVALVRRPAAPGRD